MITSNVENVYDTIELESKTLEETEDEEIVNLDSKKAYYKKDGKPIKKAQQKKKLESSERDPWKLNSTAVKKYKSYKRMASCPLEMFKWNRVIVDE